jgi:hypothetical protein
LAGSANLAIGLVAGGSFPSPSATVATMVIGVVGYGISLMLFVLALRSLGTARTGTYFALAPFAGVAVAAIGFGESLTGRVWVAGGLMAAGLWLQLTERHEHHHLHEPLVHSHLHAHDDPHRDHVHAQNVDVTAPHSHEHRHEPLAHAHAHRPDIHHRHREP